MTIQGDLVATLEGHAPLAALVGTRIYPLQFPQGSAFPAVTYQQVSAPTEQGLTNRIAATRTWFQLTVFGLTYPAVNAAGLEILAALEGMSGVHEVTLSGPLDGHDPDAGLYRQHFDVRILHGGGA